MVSTKLLIWKVNMISFFKSQPFSPHSFILTIMLIISVLLNVLMIQRLDKLKDLLPKPGNNAPVLITKPGTKVTPLVVKDVNGKTIAIKYNGEQKPTVLYFFSPSCTWCAYNIDNIKYLEIRIKDKYRLIGISLDRNNIDKYALKHSITFPIFISEVTPNMQETYGLIQVPQTIVITNDSKLEKSWQGAYHGKVRAEVEEYFNVKLPGIAEIRDTNY